MKKKLIITSGTGFLGKVLTDYLRNDFAEIVILSRQNHTAIGNVRYVRWDAHTLGDWKTEFKDVSVIINLTGKSVDCRYTEKNKKEIVGSRVRSVNLIADALRSQDHKADVWINAASATIYDSEYMAPHTEARGRIGDDFSMNVCKVWEQSFFEKKEQAGKMIAMRIAMVYGSEGGVYPILKKLVKAGLGGTQAGGRQKVSWIHAIDYARMTKWLIHKADAEAVYNCCAPTPLSNKKIMQLLREKIKPLFALPQPAWMIKIGSFLMRTEAELVLKSRYVIPERALSEGFIFAYPTFEEALESLD